MNIEITKQEACKILDAIKAYTTDYSVTGSVNKTLSNVTKKLQNIIDNQS